MNFLAHLSLSGDDPKVMIGNFIGDFVKGRNLHERFEPTIVLGIELHRSIDEFTDKHAVVKQSKKRLQPKYRHYAGVIVDVFYDHFLAKNWTTYYPESLSTFTSNAYQLLEESHDILPDEVNGMLPHLIKGNWLMGYAHVEGIHRALSGMATRTPYASKMNEASVDLVEGYDNFHAEFATFFPELKKFANDFLAERDRAASN